jgi:hypothetical protein
MKKVISPLMILLFSTTVLFASDIGGKWTATIDTDNGPMTFYAEFTVNGETLTGTLWNDQGSVEISQGKISGSTFEYAFELDYQKIIHKGKLIDGKLKINTSGAYGEREFTMKRIKEG